MIADVRPRSGATILVVDDEVLVRMVIKDLLGSQGYRMLEAGNGPEALRVLRSVEHIDLLVSDVGLPNGMNGRQVADAACVLSPSLKVMFVTGYADSAVLNRGDLDSDMHTVTKPFDVGELGQRISRILEEH